jgi:hypothetical protein
MSVGKAMPPIKWLCKPANWSRGCVWSMSTAVPSWRPSFSPQGYWSSVPARAVQAHLRQAFRHWGRPEQSRFDNGDPWGSAVHELPSELALWLVGLGIDLHFNPPSTPEHNGVVERSQGTSKNWAEPQTCRTAAQLQARLQQADQIQRERYPHRDGASRAVVYPGLRHSGRSYRPSWERQHWEWARVQDYLSRWVVQRRADRHGKISIYNWTYHLGSAQAGKHVRVQYDPGTNEWVVTDEADRQLRRFAAVEVSRGRIVGLKMSRRHG